MRDAKNHMAARVSSAAGCWGFVDGRGLLNISRGLYRAMKLLGDSWSFGYFEARNCDFWCEDEMVKIAETFGLRFVKLALITEKIINCMLVIQPKC